MHNLFSSIKDTSDPREFSASFKDELAALKKVNNFGRKLATSTEYYMYQGMLFAYDYSSNTAPGYEVIFGNHISVGFIDPKLMGALSPLLGHMVRVNGGELYSLLQTGNFVGYKEYMNRLELTFECEEMVNEVFEINKFAKYATEKGFTDFEIVVAYKKGWESNMEIYNLYLKYLATLKSHMELVKHTTTLYYTNTENRVMEKVIKVMNKLKDCEHVYSKSFDQEEISNISNSNIPTELYPVINGKQRTLRIMKNLFLTMSAASKLSLDIFDINEKEYYMSALVDTSSTFICNIYKCVKI